MFTSMRLRNFRGFADTGEIKLGRLTILVGPNNAGKSSLLHALLLLKQTIESRSGVDPLVTSGPYVDVGSFDDIVRGGASESRRAIGIALEVSPDYIERARRDFPSEGLRIGTRLEMAFELDRPENQIRLKSSRYLEDGRVTVGVRRSSTEARYVLSPPGLAKRFDPRVMNFLADLSAPRDVLRDADDPTARSEFLAALQTSIAATAQRSIWMSVLEAIDHIAPLRSPVPRYTILGRTAGSVSTAGGEALLNRLRAGDYGGGSGKTGHLINQVDYWISKRFEMLARIRLMDVDRAGRVLALLGDEPQGFKDINVANMGEGMSQLLPVIASVVTTAPEQCLLVEQPEIHLHPAAQADLGDLFVDSVSGEQSPQFLVETHSEHLLLRVRRRIADGTVDPGAVSVLYVERRGKAHSVRQLVLDAKGNFESWPRGFFEEGYEEALLLAQAAASRD